MFACYMNLAARMYTRCNTNETRDEHREPNVGCKNDKACHGDEQALAITFTWFDAEPFALICKLNYIQKEKKGNAWEFKDPGRGAVTDAKLSLDFRYKWQAFQIFFSISNWCLGCGCGSGRSGMEDNKIFLGIFQ